MSDCVLELFQDVRMKGQPGIGPNLSEVNRVSAQESYPDKVWEAKWMKRARRGASISNHQRLVTWKN